MQNFSTIILAAGKGTRMGGDLPKVLYPVCGWTMIRHAMVAASDAGSYRQLAVIGTGKEKVRAEVEAFRTGLQSKKIEFVEQVEQKGTGDAVRSCLAVLEKSDEPVVIVNGDSPLLDREMFAGLIEQHKKQAAEITIGCMQPEKAHGYGRIVGSLDAVTAIVEEKDASEDQRKITICNGGVYVVSANTLHEFVPKIKPSPVTGEFYLPDIVALAVQAGRKVCGSLIPNETLLGVNTPVQLSEAEAVLRRKMVQQFQTAGVYFQDPRSVYLEKSVTIAAGAQIGPSVNLSGSTDIGGCARVEQGSVLRNARIAVGAHIKAYSYLDDCQLGEKTAVGPFAHLRPGTEVHADVKIGNFVELKKAVVRDGAKISHLSYVGDADIGRDVNLGCGFITCNYDGVKKHQTTIEDGVFVGSDVQMVAPVTIKSGAYVASGSTITEDVPAAGMAIARSRQENKPGYAKKLWDRLKNGK